MCFSKDISLFAFITGIIGGLLCYKVGTPDYKIIGLFFMFTSLMQGIEYLIWDHQVCDDYNKNLSKIGLVLNHLQPLILFILIYIFGKNENKKYLSLLILYIIIIIPYSLQFKNECTIKNKHNHLKWEWNDMKYHGLIYFIFLLCFITFGSLIGTNNMFSLFVAVSYIISYEIYNKKKVIGPMWCFFSILGPYLFLFVRNVIKI